MKRGSSTRTDPNPKPSQPGPLAQEYAGDQEAFFRDFASAYVKLAELGVR